MRIGIIGTGRIGQTVARLWGNQGHRVYLGSRELERAQAVAEGCPKTVEGVHFSDLPRLTDILLLAFPWYALTDVARGLPTLDQKIVIDCINPITSSGSLALGHKRSAGEEIARTFPSAKVIKAFNHIHHHHFTNPVFNSMPADAFFCSDFDEPKEVVSQLAREMGFEPVDLGPLKFARYLEPLALLWIQHAFHIGHGPDFTIKFIRRDG